MKLGLEGLITKKKKLKDVPLSKIRAKKQMRQTFVQSSIELFADNIFFTTLQNRIVLNHKTKTGANIIAAGERRFRAYQVLYDNPERYLFPDCVLFINQHSTAEAAEFEKYIKKLKRKNPKQNLSVVIEKHYRQCIKKRENKPFRETIQKIKRVHKRKFSRIPSKVYDNLTPLEHKAIQTAENSYEAVPPAEAAECYVETRQLMERVYKNIGQTLTKAEFSRIINKSISTIDAAEKFVILDKVIRDYVKCGDIQYGTGVQLIKIEDLEVREQYAETAILKNLNERGMRDLINNYLQEQNSGQGNLLDSIAKDPKQELETVVKMLGVDFHASLNVAAQYYNKLCRTKKKLKRIPLKLRSVNNRLREFRIAFQELGLYSDILMKSKEDVIEDKMPHAYFKLVQ